MSAGAGSPVLHRHRQLTVAHWDADLTPALQSPEAGAGKSAWRSADKVILQYMAHAFTWDIALVQCSVKDDGMNVVP
jgi:hypothetical protein